MEDMADIIQRLKVAKDTIPDDLFKAVYLYERVLEIRIEAPALTRTPEMSRIIGEAERLVRAIEQVEQASDRVRHNSDRIKLLEDLIEYWGDQALECTIRIHQIKAQIRRVQAAERQRQVQEKWAFIREISVGFIRDFSVTWIFLRGIAHLLKLRRTS